MRNIMYEDCNHNADFLKGLFAQIQALSIFELMWRISDLDFFPLYKGDFVNGVPSAEMQKVLDFQKRSLDEYTVVIGHNEFMDLLENIRVIEEGKFETSIRGKKLKLKIFDGYLMEISGAMEDRIKISEKYEYYVT